MRAKWSVCGHLYAREVDEDELDLAHVRVHRQPPRRGALQLDVQLHSQGGRRGFRGAGVRHS